MRHDIRHFCELLFLMTEREIRVRYKNTVFGFFWLVANPLLQMLIIGFVFRFFMKEPIAHYYFYLFVGILAWNFFSHSLMKVTSSIIFERTLIKKAMFPRVVIPLSIILSNAVHFFAALLLYAIPVLFIGTMTWASIAPIVGGIVLLFLFTIGVSFLTATVNVRFRDVNFFVQAILTIWFYATPIVYSFSVIPSGFVWLWGCNPLTSVMQLFQYGFTGSPFPTQTILIANSITIIVFFSLGLYVFQKESKHFDDWV